MGTPSNRTACQHRFRIVMVLACSSLPTAGSLAETVSLSRSAIALGQSPITFGSSRLPLSTASSSFPRTLEAHETASTVEITLAADVLFDFDKADIRSAAASPLHDLAEVIRGRARGSVTIRGYTDGLGGDVYNQRLSERRAAAVKSWLVARERLPGKGFATAGFGARDPVAPNRHPDGSDDPEGRQLNRRVTVLIRK